MTTRASLRCIALFPLLILATTPLAHAQGTASSDFCALTGTDLLATLDGSWTINQGAGTAVGFSNLGMAGVPLPPPPPASVSFRYDAEHRVIDVEGENVEGQMFMFPAPEQQQTGASSFIGEAPNEKGSAGCEWSAIPILIGTNFYYLTEAEDKEYYSGLMGELQQCAHPEQYDYQHPDFQCELFEDYLEYVSRNELGMDMTLILRFSDPHSASGMLYFKGGLDKKGAKQGSWLSKKGSSGETTPVVRFRAWAPVTLSR